MRLDRKVQRCLESFVGYEAGSIESLMADCAVPLQAAVSVKTSAQKAPIRANVAPPPIRAKES